MAEPAAGDPTVHWLAGRTGVAATPPPSQRHSELAVWDESERPTAAEPDASVEFTSDGLAMGRHLLDVHEHYRRELERVRHVLDQVRTGVTEVGAARSTINTMTLRANTWVLGSVCQSYCLAVTGHHGMEDESVLPYLGSRDRDLRPILDRLGEEHLVIHHLLESVDAALVGLAARPDDLDPLQEAVDLLTDALLSHFAYEERELVGPLSRFGFYPGRV